MNQESGSEVGLVFSEDDPYVDEEDDIILMMPMGAQGFRMPPGLEFVGSEYTEEIVDVSGNFYQKKVVREGPGFKEVTIVSGGMGGPPTNGLGSLEGQGNEGMAPPSEFTDAISAML